MNQPEVRPANMDEAHNIFSMITKACSNGYFVLPRSEGEVRDLISRGRFLVAVEGGRVLGCASLEEYGGLAELRSLVVDDGLKGGGIGTRLVHGVESLASGKYNTLYAFASEGLVEFYKRQGFQDMGRFLGLDGDMGNALEKMERYCLGCDRYRSGVCHEHLMRKPLP